MVVGLLTRTTSRVAKSTSRQIARRNTTTEPKKYNLPDFDDTTANPHKFWPFSWNKRWPFTVKYALYCSSGFSLPYFIVYYQMVLKD